MLSSATAAVPDLEQVGPAGAAPTAVNQYGNRSPMPAAVTVPKATLAALEALPMHE